MSLLILFHTSTPAPATPQIGNPIGLLLALTYSEGGTPEPPVIAPQPDVYIYTPNPRVIAMFDRLERMRKNKNKSRKAAKKYEKLALDLIKEFEPGPDLPPISTATLDAAIDALRSRVNVSELWQEPRMRDKVIEELFTLADELRKDEDELDEIITFIMLI